MNERTTVRLPPGLLAAAKKKAAAEGRTLTSLIEDGLRQVIADATKVTRDSERVLPRVSKARGGVRPGIDLSDGSALQDLDDLDYVERLKTGFR